MGTWGAGAFHNDDAMDWVGELTGAQIASVLDDAFDGVLAPSADSYIEAPESQVALAAAEIVAAAVGAPTAELPDEARAWVDAHGRTLTPRTYRRAYEALVRVARNSELRELWEEADSLDEWKAHLVDLQRRLAGAAGADASEELLSDA